MFRVSYIDSKNRLAHKGGFKTDKAAYAWISQMGASITPLKLLVWSEDLQCYETLHKFF